ncbi:MAG TPA: ATP-dependent helicase, partial [Trebonia sp.]
ERSRDAPDFEVLGKSFEALAASATFDRVLYDGGEFGTATEAGSLEEEDYLGLPGLLDPDQVAVLLRKRQSRQLTARSAAAAAPVAPAPSAPAATVSREGLAALRKELNGLVGAWSHRTGQPHGVIHAELRQACGGPAIPQASAEQIRDRIAMIRKWALSRR